MHVIYIRAKIIYAPNRRVDNITMTQYLSNAFNFQVR